MKLHNKTKRTELLTPNVVGKTFLLPAKVELGFCPQGGLSTLLGAC